jgi:hypothetical protein
VRGQRVALEERDGSGMDGRKNGNGTCEKKGEGDSASSKDFELDGTIDGFDGFPCRSVCEWGSERVIKGLSRQTRQVLLQRSHWTRRRITLHCSMIR